MAAWGSADNIGCPRMSSEPRSWHDVDLDELTQLHRLPRTGCEARCKILKALAEDAIETCLLAALENHSQQSGTNDSRRRPGANLITGLRQIVDGSVIDRLEKLIDLEWSLSQPTSGHDLRQARRFARVLAALETIRKSTASGVTSNGFNSSSQTLEHLCSVLEAISGDKATVAARATSGGFAQAATISLFGKVNGAYYYEAADWGHETLATLAWLGWLCAGRKAVMPPFVAATLSDYEMPRTPSRQISADCQYTMALLQAATAVIGSRRLDRATLSVSRTKIPQVVLPFSGLDLVRDGLAHVRAGL